MIVSDITHQNYAIGVSEIFKSNKKIAVFKDNEYGKW